jgi:alkylation response protein AidB-like acyl-CoA dehydrogenase
MRCPVPTAASGFFTADHDAYREAVREFLKRNAVPHHDAWEERLVDRAAWTAAGANGIVGARDVDVAARLPDQRRQSASQSLITTPDHRLLVP